MESLNPQTFRPIHFMWAFSDGVATITLNRPEKKNPLTFESYAELRDTFRLLRENTSVHAVVLTGAGDNFCSGGDVHEIIGPLVKMSMPELMAFTHMTVELIRAMRQCPQMIVAAIDGVCVGAGAALAMASDFRFGTARSSTAFLFTKVGLAGCDMGACYFLPRMVGLTKATELLVTGRSMKGDEALSLGFFTKIFPPDELMKESQSFAQQLASGPRFAISMTKQMITQEFHLSFDQALEAEAQAQAICMKTDDFKRAYEAFVAKQKPLFQGN